MITIKKLLCIFFIVTIVLVGCSKEIKPKKVIESEFSKSKAEVIMKRAWKPVNDMKGIDNTIKPNVTVSSREEFFEEYDFSFMDERYVYSTIYESIVELVIDKETKMLVENKDNEGNILFKERVNIPTIYDKGVIIEKAYIRDSRYSEKYSHLDIVELVVIESSDKNIEGTDSGFNRKNIFRQNEEGEWILYSIEGSVSYSW
ncbi:MAG: hypothetical protein GX201_04865 [Clostridiales bacterium]|nr:hypothetical protein [Clostridiales bacterium]